MQAKKGNKVYMIDAAMKNDYVARGFDITEDNGTVIEYGAGKTVPYGEFKVLEEKAIKLEKENKKLKEEMKELKKDAK